jgi:hypothetical protein
MNMKSFYSGKSIANSGNDGTQGPSMCTSLGNSLKNLEINIAGKNRKSKRHEYLEEVPQNLVLGVQPTPMTPMEVNHRKHKHLNL